MLKPCCPMTLTARANAPAVLSTVNSSMKPAACAGRFSARENTAKRVVLRLLSLMSRASTLRP